MLNILYGGFSAKPSLGTPDVTLITATLSLHNRSILVQFKDLRVLWTLSIYVSNERVDVCFASYLIIGI